MSTGFASSGCREPHTFAPTEVDDKIFAAGAAAVLLGRSLDVLVRGTGPTFDLQDFQRCAERHQQAAVDDRFSGAVATLIETGWTPLDLHEAGRRQTASSAITHLLDVAADETAKHPAHLVDPRWRAQLEQLGASVPATGGESPALDWARRSGLDWPTALQQLLTVLVVACGLPVIDRVLPARGSAAGSAAGADGIDAKVLRRVRGLLATAESTEHPKEADALTTKAQQLMTRYSIERAVAESSAPAGSVPLSRRLWLESPYVDAKALLVVAVARANNCCAVQSSALGCVSIVGHATDLDVGELLTTSLLVQATRAMTLAGPQTTRYGTSRTRSFRQSFLIAYAVRIGERLAQSARSAESSYDGDHSGVLVPVLAARREAVEDRVSELFPALVERRVSSSNPAGWGAGRAAADLASFDVHSSLTPAQAERAGAWGRSR